MMKRVLLDLNSPGFQKRWLLLERDDAEELRMSLKKIIDMSWQQVYQSKGFNWEKIHTKQGENDEILYSIRVTKKFRAVVVRLGDYMRIISLHPDHDSAYH